MRMTLFLAVVTVLHLVALVAGFAPFRVHQPAERHLGVLLIEQRDSREMSGGSKGEPLDGEVSGSREPEANLAPARPLMPQPRPLSIEETPDVPVAASVSDKAPVAPEKDLSLKESSEVTTSTAAIQPPYPLREVVKPPGINVPTSADRLDGADSAAVVDPSRQQGQPVLTAPVAALDSRQEQRYPLYRYGDPPVYPPGARRRGLQGVVELDVKVLASGHIGELRIRTSSGYRSLDQAAEKAVRKWRFTPAITAGVAIESWVVVPVQFVLDDHE